MERLKDGGVRLALVGAIGIVSLLAPSSAGATSVPGPNGTIAFTSGRAPQNNDSEARIWTTAFPFGSATQVTFSPPSSSGQHRQPNWSPDHTKLVYAISPSGEIRIKDFTTGTDSQFVAAAAAQDRPSWSPDGTKIAYGSGGIIYVKPFPSGSAVAVTSGATDERPVWSPDGNTIYFNRLVAANDNDIYKKTPVTLGATATAVVTGGLNDWQPAVSPDGSRLCFTRGPKSDAADLYTASATALNTNVAAFAANATLADINCVWSPDGTKIAYTEGAFGKGQLVEKNSDGSSVSTQVIAEDASPSVYFDGNADWATNFRPECQNATVSVGVNGFLSIPLGCTDQDISDNKFISREIVTQPGHGNLGAVDDNTDTVIYTPAKDFKGTDTFTFKGNDTNSDSAPATITVNVGNTGEDVTAANIDKVGVSRRTWRRGSSLPAVLSRAKVGTTISYRLSENARVTLTFSRRARGRKVGRRCVKPRRSNRRKRRCARYVKAGTLRFDGKAGTNRVKFQGRLSRRKRLALGRYRLTVGAKDAAGNVSKRSRPVAFRIVRR
jgi:Tol biopolymer transport system component